MSMQSTKHQRISPIVTAFVGQQVILSHALKPSFSKVAQHV